MATNHTTNYNLNLWEANDNFVREEFNENTTKLDAAIKAEADARSTAVNAINTTLSGMVKLAAGHYIGDNEESRFISTGFTPKAVFVSCLDEYKTSVPVNFGGLAVPDSPVKYYTGDVLSLEVVSSGFRVHQKSHGGSNAACVNCSGYHYNYIAIG